MRTVTKWLFRTFPTRAPIIRLSYFNRFFERRIFIKNEFLSRKAEIDNLTIKENEVNESVSNLENEYRQKEKAYADLQSDREELHEQKLQLELARSEKVSLEKKMKLF